MAKGENGCFLGLGGVVALALVGGGIWFGSRPANDLAAAVKEYQSLGLPMKLEQVSDHDLKPEEDFASYLGRGRVYYKSIHWRWRILREPDLDLSALPIDEQAEVKDLLHSAKEIDHCKGFKSATLMVRDWTTGSDYELNAVRLVSLLCIQAKESAGKQDSASTEQLKRAWQLSVWIWEKALPASENYGKQALDRVLNTAETCLKLNPRSKGAYRQMILAWKIPAPDFTLAMRVAMFSDLKDLCEHDGHSRHALGSNEVERDLTSREISFKMQPALAKYLRTCALSWQGKHDRNSIQDVLQAGAELRRPLYPQRKPMPTPKRGKFRLIPSPSSPPTPQPKRITIEDLAAHLKALQKSVQVS